MNRKISITTKQLGRLLEDFRQIPDEPVGEHLTDDEAIGYAMELLSVEEERRVDSHLAACSDCAEEVERLIAGALAWNGPQGAERLAKVRRRIPIRKLRKFLKSSANAMTAFFTLPQQPTLVGEGMGGDFDAERKPVDFESDDGTFGLLLVEGEDGSVTLRFDSSELELEGAIVRFHKGNWQREVRLKKVPGQRVGAKVTVSREERAKLLIEGEFNAEPVNE